MKHEVFGPILTIRRLKNFSLNACLDFVKDRPKPLAAYIFSESLPFLDEAVKQLDAGAVMTNDTVMHFAAPLPFGGVGHSGMGAYHGKHSFDCFSHMKPVVHKSSGGEFINR